MNTDSQWSKQEACFVCATHGVARCQSQHQLANEFDVPSVLNGQVSLAAVNQIYVIHETERGSLNVLSSLNKLK